MQKAGEHVDAPERVAERLGDGVVARQLRPLALHPLDQLVDERGNVSATHGQALVGRLADDLAFQREDRIELLHRRECDRRDHLRAVVARARCDVGKLEQIASRMGPASDRRDRTRLAIGLVKRVEAAIGIGLQNPAVAGEMPFGMRAAAIGRVVVDRGRRRGAAKRTIVTHIGPQPAGPGLSLGQHRHGGVIAMDPLGREHVMLDEFEQRQQRGRAGADMIGHGRHRKLDALARKLLALPVQRLMIGVFVDQDHCQQARACEATGDGVEWSRRLADLLAGPAAELLTHVLGNEHLPRHHVERLGDVLADLRELVAAAAQAAGRRGMHDAPAGQMIGEIPPRRRPPQMASHRIGPLRFGLCLARFRDHVFELQFQLIEQALAALRARAVYLALHLRDHQSKVLDQGFRTEHFRAHLDEGGLQRVIVFGKLIVRHRHDANRSQ